MSTYVVHSHEESDFTWIIIVSICAGLLFLVIIVLVLWKCGFFKRKRYPKSMEHQAQRQKLMEQTEEEEAMKAQVDKRNK